MHLVTKHARLRILFDLFYGLNLERYELSKSGKLLFNHPQGTNDDRFWALALAVYAAEQGEPPLEAHRENNLKVAKPMQARGDS